MSVSKFIDEINKKIPPVHGKVYGLANSIVRIRKDLSIEMLPGIINKDGEVFYVGLDDVEPFIMYHKSGSITPISKAKGTGNTDDIVNSYNNSVIVYNDRKRTGMLPDEIVLFLQSVFPEMIRMEPYKTVSVRFSSVVLSDQAVFASEYQNTEFKLPPGKNLIQVNYIIESVFRKGCFEKCPLTI